ncbi:hypothetical protein C0J52_01627 [Blattella germanica]|nr:hypothetical protein C0J52_01627 [Blattella germanica]
MFLHIARLAVIFRCTQTNGILDRGCYKVHRYISGLHSGNLSCCRCGSGNHGWPLGCRSVGDQSRLPSIPLLLPLVCCRRQGRYRKPWFSFVLFCFGLSL